LLLQHRVLTDDLASLLILGCIPKARIVAKVQRDIPWDGWPTERAAILRLAERLGERFEVDRRRLEPDQPMQDSFADSLIGADVAIADNPEIERHRLLMRWGGLRNGTDHGCRQRQGTRFEQRPSSR